MQNFDILCCSETKTDDTGVISILGYDCIMQSRKQKFTRRSGGLCMFVKREICKHIKIIDTSSDYILWININSKLTNLNEDMLLGALYIPPTQSKYLNDDEFMTLEIEITAMTSQYKYAILTGDLNARTSNLRDYTIVDNFITDLFDIEQESLEFFDQQTKLLSYRVPLERSSQDKKTNNNGFKLLEICKNNNLFIVNGRVGKDKNLGQLTFRNTSLIDYVLSSVELFPFMQDFEVVELDTLFSDGHSLLSLTLNFPPSLPARSYHATKKQPSTYSNWEPSLKHFFIQNLDSSRIEKLNLELNQKETNKENINYYASEIAEIFSAAANSSFKTKYTYRRKKSDKPWYGLNCKRARESYMTAKSKYHKRKNVVNKANLDKNVNYTREL